MVLSERMILVFRVNITNGDRNTNYIVFQEKENLINFFMPYSKGFCFNTIIPECYDIIGTEAASVYIDGNKCMGLMVLCRNTDPVICIEDSYVKTQNNGFASFNFQPLFGYSLSRTECVALENLYLKQQKDNPNGDFNEVKNLDDDLDFAVNELSIDNRKVYSKTPSD